MADNTGTQQLFDLWKKQVDEGTQAWLKMTGQGQAPDPQAFWRPFMDQGMQAWSKVMTQGSASPDLLAQWKQFLDQWIAAWSKVLEQAMGTENFAQAMGKQLEGFLNVSGPVKKAAEQQVEAGLLDGGVARCHATTRKGKACQRTPLPGRDYCPSHQHLEQSATVAA